MSAVSTKWSASSFAAPAVAFAKWYAPIGMPAAFAFARFVA